MIRVNRIVNVEDTEKTVKVKSKYSSTLLPFSISEFGNLKLIKQSSSDIFLTSLNVTNTNDIFLLILKSNDSKFGLL